MAQVIVQQAQRYPPQGACQRADLGEDVDAVLLLVHHAVDAASFAFDPLQPRQVAALVGNLTVAAISMRRLRGLRRDRGGHELLLDVARLVKLRSRRLFPTTNTLEK